MPPCCAAMWLCMSRFEDVVYPQLGHDSAPPRDEDAAEDADADEDADAAEDEDEDLPFEPAPNLPYFWPPSTLLPLWPAPM